MTDERKMKIYPDILSLVDVDRYMEAALVREQCLLVVWGETAEACIARGREVQAQMMQPFIDAMDATATVEKREPAVAVNEVSDDGFDSLPGSEDWLEENVTDPPRRPALIQPIQTGLTLALLIAAIGSGWRNVAIELLTDSNWIRLAFLLVTPLQMWLALVSRLCIRRLAITDPIFQKFFFQSVVGSITQVIGPIGQMKANSKFYSGVRPKNIRTKNLPHVTIQCPVYKEDLTLTIKPTMDSIKAAIARYQSRGGSANIFVNDDGINLISADAAQARREFYKDNEIGWVARPKHIAPNAKGKRRPFFKGGCFGRREPKPQIPEGVQPFIRAGKFKKASNMNFAMAFSVKVEDKLALIERHEKWTSSDERREYERCCEEVFTEMPPTTQYAGNVRMGDYILIIDSDTRVPNDCLIYALTEMERSPEVAILQFTSGVQNVTTSFFEMGITFFTNLIYTAITYAVANGDVAPFVGHNAFLRWSALQHIAYESEGDPTPKYWSESTVSEDFDMALRLQIQGYLVRFAAYSCHANPEEEKEELKKNPQQEKQEFKEGVSLTVYDELSRWEKYAYGCSELIFHPLKYWPRKGPFTPLFRMFIGSNMPLPSKLTIMAYVGTYYAIGCAWILTIANYFLTGWFNGILDRYYVDSFKIYFAIIIVFSGMGNFALAILRIRCGEQDMVSAFWGNFKWVILLCIYLGGISLHVSWAIISHLLKINIEWGATMKEQEDIPFQEEIKKIFTRFRKMMCLMVLLSGGMVYLALGADPFWRINAFTAIWPLATIIFSHFFLPIILNPGLVKFKW